MNSHWPLAAVDSCESLEAADVERCFGGIAPIAMERLRIGGALRRAAPPSPSKTDSAPVRQLKWAHGGSRAAEMFFVSGAEQFSARQNVQTVLATRKAPSDADRDLARAALGRLQSREGEDVDAWAFRLASDLGKAGE